MTHHLARIAAALGLLVLAGQAHAEDPVARGRYLVEFGGCGDCHTAGHFTHQPAPGILGGSDVGFGIPGVGVFIGPNLTPDKATGLGSWTDEQIADAITKGVRPDGRVLSPMMPWEGFAHLSHADVMAIVAYLRTLPPISHKVPGPYGPTQTPDVLVMTIVPGPVFASFKPPPK
jgi:mono/diheme cytochrome c family protein